MVKKFVSAITIILLIGTVAAFTVLDRQLSLSISRTFQGIELLYLLYGFTGLIFGVLLDTDRLVSERKKPGPWQFRVLTLMIKGIPLTLLAVFSIPMWFPIKILGKLVDSHTPLFLLLMTIALGNTVSTALEKGLE